MRSPLGSLVLSFAIFLTGSSFAQQPATFPKAQFLSQTVLEVARLKKTKIEGGDFDDKKDRISFKITVKNNTTTTSFDDVTVEFYLLSQNQVNTRAYKLMQAERQKFSVAPLQQWAYETPEVVSAWDNTGAVFGEKYKGWIVRVLDPQGNLILEKSSSSFFTNTDTLPGLKVGAYVGKDLKPMKL